MTLKTFVDINGANKMFWGSLRQLVRAVQKRIIREKQVWNASDPWNVTFQIVGEATSEVLDGFAALQDVECRNLGQILRTKEHWSSGRIKLDDFYALPLDRAPQEDPLFDEPMEYLLQVGAAEKRRLSPNGPEEVLVIISNYLLSRANCMASQGIYTVCCLNPCEDLLRSIEAEVKAPEADPDLLVAIVGDLPSLSVQAPRGLEPELRGRLGEVARHHGGKVPLHGRLFAQWLHHAYPLECPYPAKSGTTKPLTANGWIDGASNLEGEQQEENERAQQLRTKNTTNMPAGQAKTKDLADKGDDEDSDIIPWDVDEELVVNSQHHPSLLRELRAIFFAVAFVSAMFAITGTVVRHVAVGAQKLSS